MLTELILMVMDKFGKVMSFRVYTILYYLELIVYFSILILALTHPK